MKIDPQCPYCGELMSRHIRNNDEETRCEEEANRLRLQGIYGPKLRGYNGTW